MSLSQLLFLVVDALITTLLVRMVLRRRKNESDATAETPATATGGDLHTTTPPVPPAATAATSAPRAATAPDMPRATAVVRTPGAAAPPEAGAETGSLTRMFGRGQLRGLATFAAEQNERIGSVVRDRWNGEPAQLPAVLDALLTDLEHDAEEQGLWLDRETLKSMLVVALRSNRVVDSDVVLEALEKVA